MFTKLILTFILTLTAMTTVQAEVQMKGPNGNIVNNPCHKVLTRTGWYIKCDSQAEWDAFLKMLAADYEVLKPVSVEEGIKEGSVYGEDAKLLLELQHASVEEIKVLVEDKDVIILDHIEMKDADIAFEK